MDKTQKDRTKKRRGFQILGWALIAWAVVNIALCHASLMGSGSFQPELDSGSRRLVLVLTCALVALNTVFYVLGGVAAIRLNFRLGTAALIGLSIFAALYLIGIFVEQRFEWDDLRYVLIPVFYAGMLCPAKKEAEADRQ